MTKSKMYRKKEKKEVEADPVIRALKASQRGDVIRVKAHLLNEENQNKIKDYVEKQDEISVFEVQGSIGMAGLRRYSPILCNHLDTLRRLSLPANNLTVPCVLDLVCALKLPENKTLELLDLSSNPIQSEGFKVLMSNVLMNTTLKALLLSKCSIGDQGVVASRQYFIGKRRTANNDFYINLSQNQIGPTGYMVIMKSLPSWMSITLTRQKPPVVMSSPLHTPVKGIEDVVNLPSIETQPKEVTESEVDSESESESEEEVEEDNEEEDIEEVNIEEEGEEELEERNSQSGESGDVDAASCEPDSETDDSRPSDIIHQTKRPKLVSTAETSAPIKPRGIPVRPRCSLAIVSLVCLFVY